MTDREAAKCRLRGRLKRLIAECDSFIADVEWWAKNRPEHEPMECEDIRVFRHGLLKSLESLERDEYIDRSFIDNGIKALENQLRSHA